MIINECEILPTTYLSALTAWLTLTHIQTPFFSSHLTGELLKQSLFPSRIWSFHWFESVLGPNLTAWIFFYMWVVFFRANLVRIRSITGNSLHSRTAPKRKNEQWDNDWIYTVKGATSLTTSRIVKSTLWFCWKMIMNCDWTVIASKMIKPKSLFNTLDNCRIVIHGWKKTLVNMWLTRETMNLLRLRVHRENAFEVNIFKISICIFYIRCILKVKIWKFIC